MARHAQDRGGGSAGRRGRHRDRRQGPGACQRPDDGQVGPPGREGGPPGFGQAPRTLQAAVLGRAKARPGARYRRSGNSQESRARGIVPEPPECALTVFRGDPPPLSLSLFFFSFFLFGVGVGGAITQNASLSRAQPGVTAVRCASTSQPGVFHSPLVECRISLRRFTYGLTPSQRSRYRRSASRNLPFFVSVDVLTFLSVITLSRTCPKRSGRRTRCTSPRCW